MVPLAFIVLEELAAWALPAAKMKRTKIAINEKIRKYLATIQSSNTYLNW